MPNITVKWGKEKLSVDVDINESPLVFKSQLFALTSVPPDRQKIVVKGKTLSDSSWNGITLAPGTMIMMMGSAEAVLEAPKAETNENSSTIQTPDGSEIRLVRGIKNLGNTCYMNSVIQSFLNIKEVGSALESYSAKSRSSISDEITLALKHLNGELRSSSLTTAVAPLNMLQNLHRAMPQFSERSNSGSFEQQDANECYVELQRLCLKGLKDSGINIEKFFKGKFIISQKCLEDDSEPEQTTSEDFFQLSCFLSAQVKYLQSGIKEKLTEEITKNSTTLSRDAKWSKKALIERLPAYLSIQMVRFFYKESSKTSAKILKDVKFPMSLDMYDMCSPSLQAKLRPQREAIKLEEDAKVEQMRRIKVDEKSKVVENEDYDELPFSFPEDEGSNNSGFYELQAVITHKGRASNGGHYVAWIKVENKWVVCDDEEVQVVTPEQVLNLSGGGDWHTAYVLVYGPRIVRKYHDMSDSENTPIAEPNAMSID
ncbi:unnamed protein product [Auanema sp. JU1783]|nr:unnamed protein product [Auanema sp. JU1783]